MIYKFLQVLMRLVTRVYFRKIYFSGINNIAPHKPAILACNHPNSFMDAILLAVLIKEPLYFLARSDVFNTPLKRWFLNKINLIPIYRLEEGSENLHKNQDTFQACYRILSNNQKILIFSEGICVQEKKLRPLRKGTARLAFGTEAHFNFNLGLEIIPITFNYTYPTMFRREVMIGVGKPMLVRSYKAVYELNPAKAILTFNNDLRQGLSENIIHLEKPENEVEIEKYLIQNRLNTAEFTNTKWLSEDKSLLISEKQICHNFYDLRERAIFAPGIFDSIDNRTLANNSIGLKNTKVNTNSHQKLLLAALFPFYLLGWILNILPLRIARWVTQNIVKKVEFYSSVLMVTGMAFYFIYLFLLMGLLVYLFGLYGILGLLLILLLGWLALIWHDQYYLFRLKKAL